MKKIAILSLVLTLPLTLCNALTWAAVEIAPEAGTTMDGATPGEQNEANMDLMNDIYGDMGPQEIPGAGDEASAGTDEPNLDPNAMDPMDPDVAVKEADKKSDPIDEAAESLEAQVKAIEELIEKIKNLQARKKELMGLLDKLAKLTSGKKTLKEGVEYQLNGPWRQNQNFEMNKMFGEKGLPILLKELEQALKNAKGALATLQSKDASKNDKANAIKKQKSIDDLEERVIKVTQRINGMANLYGKKIEEVLAGQGKTAPR